MAHHKSAASSSGPMAAGDSVYVLHPAQSWVLGRIVKAFPNPANPPNAKQASHGATYSSHLYDVKTCDAERQCAGETLSSISEWHVEVCDESMANKTVDDLLQLTHLHDATLLRCLYLRYMNDIVYTNIGAIVVALNPFNYQIPHYKDDQISKYLAEAGGYISEKLLPHSWSQAHNTYHDLKTSLANQCILISGESGAGKTEATKIVVKYLSKVSALAVGQDAKAQADAVLAKMMACSPVLESFGNARTVRNDNSSRFGKLMQLKFDRESTVVLGAFTTKYLLEKSRIIGASPGERVYHAFYLAARSPTAAKEFGFDYPLEQNTSLNSGKTLDNSEYNTAKDFLEVCSAMDMLGLTPTTVQHVWSIASLVVHQCNLVFVSDGGEGSQLQLTNPRVSAALSDVVRLGGLDGAVLLDEYLTTTLTINGVQTRKLNAPFKAADIRDAFSKAVYDALFGSLVDRCNAMCDVEAKPGGAAAGGGGGGDDFLWIALLDIFGFEDFEFNSFEQLCINLANETLQSHYNEYIFARDMEVCRAEGIDTVDIVCPDNRPCVDLVAGPKGILTVLDDQCSLGKGTDLAFLDSILRDFEGKNPYFARKKLSKNTFVVKHYAGDVSYDVTGWLDKNRDTLKDVLKDLSRRSSNPLVATLFPAAAAAKAVSVGTFFKRQLQQLMAIIECTNPHWIRCVKPHPAKKPRHFSGPSTLTQLESSGVLGTVKIRKAGYPVRFLHVKFVCRYIPLAPLPAGRAPTSLSAAEALAHCQLILNVAQITDPKLVQTGKTLMFLKSDTYVLLEKKRTGYVKLRAAVMQRVGKGFRTRRRLFFTSKAMILQRIGRASNKREELFAIFCDRNRERLLEERKKREEEHRRLEEQRRADEARRAQHLAGLIAEQHDVLNAEWSERQRLEQHLEAELFTVAEEPYNAIVELREEERDREAAAARRAAEEDRKRRMAAFIEALRELSGPLIKEAVDGLDEVTFEEAAERLMLTKQRFFTGVNVQTMVDLRVVMAEELRQRRLVEMDLVDAAKAFEDRAHVTRRLTQMEMASRKLQQSLEYNRRLRHARDMERRQRAATAERSMVELAIAPIMMERGEQQDDDTDGPHNHHVSRLLSKNSRARDGSIGTATPPAAEAATSVGATPSSHPAVKPVDGSPSISHPRSPGRSVVPDSETLLKRLDEMDKLTRMQASRPSGPPSAAPYAHRADIRPLSSVELHQRVYCPARHRSGIVVAFPADAAILPKSLRRSFLVKYDRLALLSSASRTAAIREGRYGRTAGARGGREDADDDTEWLDISDVCVRLGIDDVVFGGLAAENTAASCERHNAQRTGKNVSGGAKPSAILPGSVLPERLPASPLYISSAPAATTSGRASSPTRSEVASVARAASPQRQQSNYFTTWKSALEESGW